MLSPLKEQWLPPAACVQRGELAVPGQLHAQCVGGTGKVGLSAALFALNFMDCPASPDLRTRQPLTCRGSAWAAGSLAEVS